MDRASQQVRACAARPMSPHFPLCCHCTRTALGADGDARACLRGETGLFQHVRDRPEQFPGGSLK